MTSAAARFGFPAALLLALAIGFALRVDVLDSGFYADDYDHYAMQVGFYPVPRAHWDMFNFGNGTREETRTLMQSGHFPWWSDPSIHLSMLRPLSSALITFDFELFGNDARLFHWHSFFWWALLVIAVGLVLQRVLPPPMAAIAVFLFALEEGHSLPLGWLANRSTLVATAFGFVALLAHLRWREHGLVNARWLSLACVALSLAAGEYAFGALAYIAAYELCAFGQSARTRVLAFAPVAALALTYLVIRHALGFGIEGSGFYISVTAAPWSFLGALSWRVPVLTAELLLGIPAEWYSNGSPWRGALLATQWFSPTTWRALPSWQIWHVCIGVFAFAGTLWILQRLPVWIGQERARTLRWLVIGALLSLVPAAGGMVSARLTVAASLGFDALLAALIVAPFDTVLRATSVVSRAASALLIACVVYVHGYGAAERSYADASWHRYRSELESAWILAAEIDESKIRDQHVFVIATQDVTTAWYLPYVRAAFGRAMPRSYIMLSGASQPHDLERVADDAIELIVISNNVATMAVGGNYRRADNPFRVGDSVSFPGLHARVTRTLNGQPQAVRFTFPSSLDDGHYLFLQSGARGLRRLELPKVGERARLMRPVYPNAHSLDVAVKDRLAAAQRSLTEPARSPAP